MVLTISTIHYDRVSRHQNLGELRCPSHHGSALSTLYLEKKRNKYFMKSGFIALSGVIYITSSEGKCLLATVMKSYDFPSRFRRVSPFLSFPMRKTRPDWPSRYESVDDALRRTGTQIVWSLPDARNQLWTRSGYFIRLVAAGIYCVHVMFHVIVRKCFWGRVLSTQSISIHPGVASQHRHPKRAM